MSSAPGRLSGPGSPSEASVWTGQDAGTPSLVQSTDTCVGKNRVTVRRTTAFAGGQSPAHPHPRSCCVDNPANAKIESRAPPPPPPIPLRGATRDEGPGDNGPKSLSAALSSADTCSRSLMVKPHAASHSQPPPVPSRRPTLASGTQPCKVSAIHVFGGSLRHSRAVAAPSPATPAPCCVPLPQSRSLRRAVRRGTPWLVQPSCTCMQVLGVSSGQCRRRRRRAAVGLQPACLNRTTASIQFAAGLGALCYPISFVSSLL